MSEKTRTKKLALSLGARNGGQLLRTREEIAKGLGPDDIGFLARMLIQATLPHSRPSVREFVRRNGNFTLRMVATTDGVGLPYGTYPRVLLSWVTDEAVRTKSPVLDLGYSLRDFLAQLGLLSTGGSKGTITTLRRQIEMLFRAAISWSYSGDGRGLDAQLFPFEGRELWWDPARPDQDDLFRSRLVLNERFFRELVSRPVPLNKLALRELARERSPLAFDIYTWLTYRMSYLHEPTEISWPSLQLQFGADYGRLDNFRAKFLEKLRRVSLLYPEAKFEVTHGGLMLYPSPPHVPTLSAKKHMLLAE